MKDCWVPGPVVMGLEGVTSIGVRLLVTWLPNGSNPQLRTSTVTD
jgi:hypothetical protein